MQLLQAKPHCDNSPLVQSAIPRNLMHGTNSPHITISLAESSCNQLSGSHSQSDPSSTAGRLTHATGSIIILRNPRTIPRRGHSELIGVAS